VLVDAVPELLTAAAEAARTAPGAAGVVDVRTVRADLAAVGQLASPSSASARSRDIGAHAHRHAGASADRLADPAASGPFRLRASTRGESDADLPDGVPAADLVWASNVVHHLPDQRRMVTALASWLAPGGCLALAEGGLSMKCLPWDIGIGEPGLQDRLIAAHGMWFHGMRTGISGSVRLPIGWNLVLAEAGLTGVTAFSYLIDVPAPLGDTGRAAVVSWLGWLARVTSGLLSADDVAVLDRLLDPDDAAYVGGRDDVFLLKASTVHLGWRK
jgi:SAM-dependent methyltransferase